MRFILGLFGQLLALLTPAFSFALLTVLGTVLAFTGLPATYISGATVSAAVVLLLLELARNWLASRNALPAEGPTAAKVASALGELAAAAGAIRPDAATEATVALHQAQTGTVLAKAQAVLTAVTAQAVPPPIPPTPPVAESAAGDAGALDAPPALASGAALSSVTATPTASVFAAGTTTAAGGKLAALLALALGLVALLGLCGGCSSNGTSALFQTGAASAGPDLAQEAQTYLTLDTSVAPLARQQLQTDADGLLAVTSGPSNQIQLGTVQPYWQGVRGYLLTSIGKDPALAGDEKTLRQGTVGDFDSLVNAEAARQGVAGLDLTTGVSPVPSPSPSPAPATVLAPKAAYAPPRLEPAALTLQPLDVAVSGR